MHQEILKLVLTFTLASALGQQGPTYFPSGFFSDSDVTSVTWAHAVNSQSALDQVLADPAVQMIEADVSRGRLNVSGGGVLPIDIPVMAHPPAIFSDLSLQSFMDKVIAYNKDRPLSQMKGVKLDFKDYFSAALGISQIGTRNTNGTLIKFPFWINADILQGPVDSQSKPKIDPHDLFVLHQRYFPTAVLSLGWTTRFGNQSDGEIITGGGYTRQNVQDMINAIEAYPQDSEFPDAHKNLPVTFAVRAGLALNSIADMMYLLNFTSTRASVTLWVGADDPKVSPTAVADFVKIVGRHKSFIDVPYSIKESSANSFGFNLVFIVVSCFLRLGMSQLCN